MTPLFKKLNYKGQHIIYVLNAPDSFQAELKEMSAVSKVMTTTEANSKIEFALVFVIRQTDVESYAQKVLPYLQGDAVLWFCYPKGTSKKYKCDINRDKGWNILGESGLEPVRQVAIDEDWSALRFRKAVHIKEMRRDFAISEEGKKRTGK